MTRSSQGALHLIIELAVKFDEHHFLGIFFKKQPRSDLLLAHNHDSARVSHENNEKKRRRSPPVP